MKDIKYRQRVNGKWHYWGFLSDGFTAPYEKYESNAFTGLHDKNGKEIYEMDIVAFRNKYDWDTDESGEWSLDHVGLVEWREEDSMYAIVDKLGDPTYHYQLAHAEFGIEVIGNIYENPELIK